MASVDWITVGPFQENTYLISDAKAGVCVLVDPGDEWRRVAGMVRRSGAELQAIWLTHAHVDHIGAIAGILGVWEVPVLLHKADLPLYRSGDRQAAAYGLPFDTPPEPTGWLSEKDVLRVGEHEFTVMHTPGHAPGHVVFCTPGLVIGGDLLFRGSIGRTDLPLSNPSDMAGSLERIARLDPDTVVLPGHGPRTTIADELESNPFLNGVARVLGA